MKLVFRISSWVAITGVIWVNLLGVLTHSRFVFWAAFAVQFVAFVIMVCAGRFLLNKNKH